MIITILQFQNPFSHIRRETTINFCENKSSVCACARVYIYIYICVCVCVYVCMYIYIFLCVCVCVCVFAFLEFIVTRREGVAEINFQNESVNMYRKISRRLL